MIYGWSKSLSDRMELDEAASVETPAAPKEMDPHAEFRMSIAEKYEARRLAEIAAGPQAVYPEPEPDPDTNSQPAPQLADVADVGEVDRHAEPVRHEVEREPVAEPVRQVAPAQPPLFPLQLPNGAVTYVTGEQMAYLAQRGAMAEMQPAVPQLPPEPAPKPATHAASFDGEKAREIVRALSYGNEDDGARVLQEFAASLAPQIDQTAILAQTKREVMAELALQQNLNTIGAEFPEIFQDRIRTQAAALQLDEIRRDPNARHFSDLDLYREACSRVRRSLGGIAPQPQPTEQIAPTQPVSQAASAAPSARLERKRGAPSMPTAADRRLGTTDDAPAVPTNRQVINQMRVSRGQPPLE